MKFNFNPNHVISEDEKQILKEFSEALDAACDWVNGCEGCPMKTLCDRTNVPAFVYAILEILGIC